MVHVFCVLSFADAVFLILYKELYYRHIYAKVSVSTCSCIYLLALLNVGKLRSCEIC